MTIDPETIATKALNLAKRSGAKAADCVVIQGTSLSVACRKAAVENIEHSHGYDLGLRVFVDGEAGACQAIVSTSDVSDAAIEEAAARAVGMAKATPPDPYAGLAEATQLAKNWSEPDGFDATIREVPELEELARATEAAAVAVPGVSNTEGAEAAYSRADILLATSGGFVGTYQQSSHSFSVSVLAGEGTDMERDYEFSSTVYAEDLESPESVGRAAGEQAVKRLNSSRLKTGAYPVVYHPRAGRQILRALAGSINGSAIARKTSFLKDKLGAQLFSKEIQIIDDPMMPRGLASKPFDAEGLMTQRLDLVQDGVLKTWVLDLATARQLGLKSNGRASRGVSSPPRPSTTNLYLAAGNVTPEELMGDIKTGFYVTETMGQGLNLVTGDYSVGASGFLIENGEITSAISEVTIAGHLFDIFANLQPANDLIFKYSSNVPTLRTDALTVAGE